MASNLSNVDNSAFSSDSTKSIYIGKWPAGVQWGAVQSELTRILAGTSALRPNLRALLLSTATGSRVRGDITGGGLAVGSGDSNNTLWPARYATHSSLMTTEIANWMQTYIEAPMDQNPSLYISEGSYADPESGNGVAAIIGGGNTVSPLNYPTANLPAIFFHSDFDYLRVKNIITFTIDLPARSRRVTAGGKKRASNLLSYNGYADYYVYQHNYGDPPPAFSAYINDDVANPVELRGLTLTSSGPLQMVSASSFRLGMVYSTNEYLCIRERYQVYADDIPARTLYCTAYFFDNPQQINAFTGMNIVHSPATWNSYSLWTGALTRTLTHTITFTTTTAGDSFNKVEVNRVGGSVDPIIPHKISNVNGAAVTPFDTYQTWTAIYNSTSLTSFTITFQTTHNKVGTTTLSYYSPRWIVRFTNTVTGEQYIDSIGGVDTFLKKDQPAPA